MKNGKASGATILERIKDKQAILDAMGTAVAEALLDHKHAGNPIATWRSGKVVLIAPEDIPDLTSEPTHPRK